MTQTLFVGTVAFDTIETPFGKVEKALGGSASYSSYAASFFSNSAIHSFVGEDFSEEYIKILKDRNINLDALIKHGKTFHWDGFYEFDMNQANTKKTELNSLLDFKVKIPGSLKNTKYLFLANLDPDLQIEAINQINKPELIVIDSMNFWIDSKKDSLLKAIKKSDVLILNDGEARQLFDTPNLIKAGKEGLKLGPKAFIIKKGEHGALLFTDGKIFNAPSFPLEVIKDPTGCGDCFGGGFIGYLAKTGDLSEASMRKAIIYGSTIASFNAEDFSLNRLKTLTSEDIDKRYQVFKDIREF